MSGAVAEAGTATRLETCRVHGIQYPQVFFPGIRGVQEGFWTGGCQQCGRDGELRQQARQNLTARQSEITRRVNERMGRLEKQILKESKEQLEDYLQSVHLEVAPQFEAYVREQHYSQELSEVETEIVGEELEKLKLEGV